MKKEWKTRLTKGCNEQIKSIQRQLKALQKEDENDKEKDENEEEEKRQVSDVEEEDEMKDKRKKRDRNRLSIYYSQMLASLKEALAESEAELQRLTEMPLKNVESPPRHVALDWEEIAAQAVSGCCCGVLYSFICI